MDGMKLGGVERALISVFHNVDFDKYDCDLLLLHDDDDLLSEVDIRVDTIRLSKADTTNKPLSFFLYYLLFKISKGKRKEKFAIKMQNACLRSYSRQLLGKYDVVIAYKHGEAENFVADCIKSKKKVLFYHHGSLIDEKLHERVIEKFTKVVAVSEGVKGLLLNAYPNIKEKTLVIPNFFDRDYLLERSKEYSVAKKDKLTLCTVGRLSAEKGYFRAVESAKILKGRGIDFSWYFIGEGDLLEDVREKVDSNGLTENVIFTGGLANPLPYVSASDVYVSASDVESYGLSMVEALALGKPVVSTKTIGGETLNKITQGIFLTDFTAESVAEGIINVSKTAVKVNCTEFDKEDKKIKELWKELLSEK